MKLKPWVTSFFIFLSYSLYAFTLNNNQNLAFQNDEVNVYVARGFCENIGLTEEDLVDLVSKANEEYWNKVSTSRLKLKSAGQISVANTYKTGPLCTSSTPSCTTNPAMNFSQGIIIACNNDQTSNFPTSSLLAVTVPVSISGKHITGSVLLINDTSSSQLTSKSKDEIIALLAHEIGHAIGLGHSLVIDSLMYYQTITARKTLGWDDIDGVTYLYPKEQPISCGTISGPSVNNKDQGSFLISLLFAFFFFIFAKKFIRADRIN